MTLDFTDTQIAFSHLSTWELQRANILFSMMAYQGLVRIGQSSLSAALKLGLPLSPLVKPTLFRQFCGGETLEEAIKNTGTLAERGIKIIPDYSVEGASNDSSFDSTALEILDVIAKAKVNSIIACAVFKPSALVSSEALKNPSHPAQKEKLKQGKDRFFSIAQAAQKAGIPIYIDAEESWFQNIVDDWAQELMELFNKEKPIIFTTLQFYRHDRLTFTEKSIGHAKKNNYIFAAKLVRGAYMEKERKAALDEKRTSPIQPSLEATERDFNKGVALFLENLAHTACCIATHNESSCYLAAEVMKKNQIAPDNPRVIFAQLYGMSDPISFNLAAGGFHTAKYLPYGPVAETLPYLFRRAQENTSVSGQMTRELSLIRTEIKRRRESL